MHTLQQSEEQQNLIQQLQQQIATLSTTVSTLQSTSTDTAPANTSSTTTVPNPTPKVPKPAKFSGKGDPDIENWLFQVQNCCSGQDDVYQVRFA